LKTTVSEIESWKKQLDIEVDTSEILPVFEKAYENYRKKVRLEGFRPGKVPMSIIKTRFGEAIRAEALDGIIQDFYRKAVEEEGLSIVAPGTIKDIQYEEGQPLRFTAEVEVEPVPEVSSYTELKVEKEIQTVTGEDVDATLEYLREQRAEKKEIQGGAETGHIVEGDVQALETTGIPIIGKKWENRSFEMGTPPLGDVVEEQLLGVKKGENRRFVLKTPEQLPDGKTRERDDHYSIDVKSIQEKILPPLDDRFASEVGEFESVSQLKEDVKQRLENAREEDSERLLRSRLADAVVKRNDFELPPSMVENALNTLWEDYQNKPEKRLEESEFKEENRGPVVWNIKWHLLWQRIADLENLAVSDEEVQKEIERMVQSSPGEEKKVKALFKDEGRRNRVKESLLEEKVIGFIKDHAKIKEVTVKPSKKQSSKIITG
jgi:trigger factor